MAVLHLHVQIIIEESRYDGHTEFSNEFFTLKCIKEKCKPHLQNTKDPKPRLPFTAVLPKFFAAHILTLSIDLWIKLN